MEQIYTIPVNEAFEKAGADHSCGCPFCLLYNKLEDNELDLILGASMMEPDVRQKTNEQGFCEEHFALMFTRGKRLPLALMMESHLDSIAKELSSGSTAGLFVAKTGEKAAKRLDDLDHSCYVCGRIEYNFSRMIETAALLWQQDPEFRKKAEAVSHFCLPHYGRFIKAAKERMAKKEFGDFYRAVSEMEMRYFDKLREDVSWFCKKFDYRYTEEPWGDAKDAPERAKLFLTGALHIHEDERKPSGGLT